MESRTRKGSKDTGGNKEKEVMELRFKKEGGSDELSWMSLEDVKSEV